MDGGLLRRDGVMSARRGLGGGTVDETSQSIPQRPGICESIVTGDDKTKQSRDSNTRNGINTYTSSTKKGSASTSASTSRSSSTKRIPKDGKPKQSTNPLGARFQCPHCPKNFTRIENLTRHQGNHDEVGKFGCQFCSKRFTRSDLRNRHRRIHVNSDSNSPPKSHVTPSVEYPDMGAPQPDFANLVHRDDRRSTSNDPTSSRSESSSHGSRLQQKPLYPRQPNDYHHQSGLSEYEHTMLLQQSGQTQGLTSLMEAALAPQETFAFTPVENMNPSMWDGFDNKSISEMGTFDADMSWTLNQFHAEPSSDYMMDYAMLANEYADPYPQYQHPEVNQIEVADAVDADTNDWPDKTSRPGTPTRKHTDPRIVPLTLLPMSWQSVVDEARSSGLSSSNIAPVQQISDKLRSTLLKALNSTNFPPNETSRPEIEDGMFPPAEVLDFFMRLYIQYLQPRFPVLHLPTFDIYTAPPLLLLAMMFVGSCHSKVDQGRVCRIFHRHLRLACLIMNESDINFLPVPENTLTLLLICLAGTWSGSKQLYAFAEAQRGMIVTSCRRARLLDCRPSSKIPVERFENLGVEEIQAAWLAWIATEKRKRLGLAIFIYDSQYPALFNNQPYVSKAETTNCIFPCPDEYWDAVSADQWKMLVGPADMPPSTYYLHALNSCLLRKTSAPPSPVPRTTELGKVVLLYAILTQIFEWHQQRSMLNPTGLMGTFGHSAAHEQLEYLKHQRGRLLNALDSWQECYQTPNTSAAALLLWHLGYISADVSLSDMHLAAGRSVNRHDSNFAEVNLKHWANGSLSDGTMNHVFTMLEICHQVIALRRQGHCSYEVAVCLFTGGIVCWAYAKLRTGVDRSQYMEQVGRASAALSGMGCWRACSLYGRILNGFEVMA